jgi:hypothetical protein
VPTMTGAATTARSEQRAATSARFHGSHQRARCALSSWNQLRTTWICDACPSCTNPTNFPSLVMSNALRTAGGHRTLDGLIPLGAWNRSRILRRHRSDVEPSIRHTHHLGAIARDVHDAPCKPGEGLPRRQGEPEAGHRNCGFRVQHPDRSSGNRGGNRRRDHDGDGSSPLWPARPGRHGRGRGRHGARAAAAGGDSSTIRASPISRSRRLARFSCGSSAR